MDAVTVPFARQIGLRRNADGRLELPFSEAVHNHLGTVHASAQIALAETASGDFLVQLFPQLVGQVVPVVRAVRAKFSKPASQTLSAYPAIADGSLARFRKQIETKGRAAITVAVAVRDADGQVTCHAAFDWFIQRLAGPGSQPPDQNL